MTESSEKLHAPSSESGQANRLADESSAYLRQHMDNPVQWHPWGEEALELARAEDRPLLVSIGYSACHWCHVMAHESFEDSETAALMNRLFVNIKVDREERPDVDQIYMDAVVRLTGQGGWPLTVFCMPDGRPFTGGTYFPPESRHGMPAFRDVLSTVAEAYHDRRDQVEKSAGEILGALAARPQGVAETPPGIRTLVHSAHELMKGADIQDGGFGRGPKFPTPTNLEALLAALEFVSGPEAVLIRDHCLQTCRIMAERGLTDHLGGGFHRYCVDGHWDIPHFEKMLYDQGLLLRVYAEAHRQTGGSSELEWPIRETAEYLSRELAAPDGGFFASQDADSEGEEGKFYVWTPDQVQDVLGERAKSFNEAYGIRPEGNFEGGTTHLIQREETPRPQFATEREALRSARAMRVPPGTDRKRVASWNGYAISGLARAGSLLGDRAQLELAAHTADFVLAEMIDANGRLLRIFDDGRAKGPAFLDDHAALLDAFLDLHRAGAGEKYLSAGVRMADEIAQRFYDPAEEDLFLTPNDGERLVHRPRSDHDGATPHATGLASIGLLRAGAICGRADLAHVAERVIRSHALFLERAPHAFPTLSRASALGEAGMALALVIGEPDDARCAALADAARRALGPDDAVIVTAPGFTPPEDVDAAWLEGREARDGRPTAYVCRGRTCSLPTHEPEEIRERLRSMGPTLC